MPTGSRTHACAISEAIKLHATVLYIYVCTLKSRYSYPVLVCISSSGVQSILQSIPWLCQVALSPAQMSCIATLIACSSSR